MDLGSTIKFIRKQKNLSQGECADLCGISQTYLSQIENNNKEPNFTTLKTIAEGLEMPLPILFFLSMTEEDVPQKKRAMYKIVSPSVKSLLHEFFAI